MNSTEEEKIAEEILRQEFEEMITMDLMESMMTLGDFPEFEEEE